MEFCIREALVAVLEINDVKQVGFIALEIFFINHNSYMNEMHQHTDCVAFEGVRMELLVLEELKVEFLALKGLRVQLLVLEGLRVELLVLEGVRVELLVLGVRVELIILEGVRVELLVLGVRVELINDLRRSESGTGVKTARLFMIETGAVIYDRDVHCPNRYPATRRKEILGSVIVAR